MAAAMSSNRPCAVVSGLMLQDMGRAAKVAGDGGSARSAERSRAAQW